jgi:hypothetical protein
VLSSTWSQNEPSIPVFLGKHNRPKPNKLLAPLSQAHWGVGERVGKTFTYTPFGQRIFCGLRVSEWVISMGHRFWRLTF